MHLHNPIIVLYNAIIDLKKGTDLYDSMIYAAP